MLQKMSASWHAAVSFSSKRSGRGTNLGTKSQMAEHRKHRIVQHELQVYEAAHARTTNAYEYRFKSDTNINLDMKIKKNLHVDKDKLKMKFKCEISNMI